MLIRVLRLTKSGEKWGAVTLGFDKNRLWKSRGAKVYTEIAKSASDYGKNKIDLYEIFE